MDKSASAIIDAACLPLSIIIIGIGNADFGKMEYLDGDNGLVDSSGRKAKRDLVQFVPFNKYKSNPMKLAENVLEELPMQLCEYMRMVGIKPDPPQMVDINNMKLSMPNNNVGNFGQNLINAGFMTNIINQELASNPINPMNATNPMKNMNRVNNMNSVGNQRPTMDNPINPAPFGMADAPHFGSLHSNQNPQNMNYSKGPTYQGVPPQGTNSYGQQGQNIGYGQSNGTGYGQPNPIGYGQNTVGQDPYGQNRGIGQNNMPYGQNYNNQNQGNAPGNVMSPTGQYKY